MDIIDSHLHVYDLKLRDSFPNQNASHEFPSIKDEGPIVMDITQEYAKEIANKSGVKKVVMVMCFDDCPEETQWVYDNAQNVDLIIGIVAGLDLTKHDKLTNYIKKFKSEFKHPKFVGIRHHIVYDSELLLSEPFQKGLKILEDENVPLDLHIKGPVLKHIPFIAKKLPKLKMVIDHLAKPEVMKGLEYFEFWRKEIIEIAKYPNVYMKLSGMVVLAEPWSPELMKPYVDQCIKAFGAQRYVRK